MRLAFRWLDKGSGLPAAHGEVSTEVAAVCQRCLEAFPLPVVAPVDAVFVAEDNDVLPDDAVDAETWTLDGDMLSLRDVVEESLVMALPLAPAHASVDDCGPLAGRIPVQEPETNRPFADLKSQLQKADE